MNQLVGSTAIEPNDYIAIYAVSEVSGQCKGSPIYPDRINGHVTVTKLEYSDTCLSWRGIGLFAQCPNTRYT